MPTDSEVEELIPLAEENNFTMTNFAVNLDYLPELEGENPPAIVEENGIYKIADNLSCTDVLIDPDFKLLVDSVLH